MGRCEPDINTYALYTKAQKCTIISHIAIPKHIQFQTGSANAIISLSSNYGPFQESQSKFHSLELGGRKPLQKRPKDFFNRNLGPTS